MLRATEHQMTRARRRCDTNTSLAATFRHQSGETIDPLRKTSV